MASAAGVSIEINHVAGIDFKLKNGKKILILETDLSTADFARLINLSGQGHAISATIRSPQAELDLRIEAVNTFSGELVAAIKV